MLERVGVLVCFVLFEIDFHKHLAKFKRESSVYLNEKPNENNNENGETSGENGDEKDSNNPFLIVEKNKEENLEFILEILQELTARRSPSMSVDRLESSI